VGKRTIAFAIKFNGYYKLACDDKIAHLCLNAVTIERIYTEKFLAADVVVKFSDYPVT